MDVNSGRKFALKGKKNTVIKSVKNNRLIRRSTLEEEEVTFFVSTSKPDKAKSKSETSATTGTPKRAIVRSMLAHSVKLGPNMMVVSSTVFTKRKLTFEITP